MPARFRISTPAATCAPPIQLARTGFPVDVRMLGEASAVSVGSVMSCGVRIDEQTVAVAIRGRQLERRRVARGIGVAEDVDRIAVAPGAAAATASRRASVSAVERRQLAAARDERVGRQHRRASRVGHDRQTRSGGSRLLAEHVGQVEDVADVVHAEHAAAPKGRVEHVVRAGERTRCATRRRGWRPRCAPP